MNKLFSEYSDSPSWVLSSFAYSFRAARFAFEQLHDEETSDETDTTDKLLRRAFTDCLTAVEEGDPREVCLAASRVAFVARTRRWPEDVPSAQEHRARLSLEIKNLAHAIDSFVPSCVHCFFQTWEDRVTRAGDLEAFLFLEYLRAYRPLMCRFAMSPATERDSPEFREFAKRMDGFATYLERGRTLETMHRFVDLVDFSDSAWEQKYQPEKEDG
ncbi:MAG: hypothetical protein JW759_08420 [Candidatus Coatesbacteria bacterium]|nr:hypothetical protein [Candidatus Coatesbacteria bacterium]